MIRLRKTDLGRGSPNQLLVLNGREGRLTVTVTRKNKGKNGGSGWRCRFCWFPPRDSATTSRVQNRECTAGVGRDLVAVNKINQVMAYSFGLAIAKSRGPEAVERMRRWMAEEEAQGTRFARVELSHLDNVGARFVRVTSTA